MKKFQANVSRELRRAYPDRRRLECQCLSAIAFVKTEGELLDCPIWVLIINVVAMDMLKSKLPPGMFPTNLYELYKSSSGRSKSDSYKRKLRDLVIKSTNQLVKTNVCMSKIVNSLKSPLLICKTKYIRYPTLWRAITYGLVDL